MPRRSDKLQSTQPAATDLVPLLQESGSGWHIAGHFPLVVRPGLPLSSYTSVCSQKKDRLNDQLTTFGDRNDGPMDAHFPAAPIPFRSGYIPYTQRFTVLLIADLLLACIASAQLSRFGGDEASQGSGEPSYSDGSAGSGYESQSYQKTDNMLIGHGTLASLAMVLLFPLGNILLRLIPSKSAWKIHAAVQILGFVSFAAAVGMGLWLAKQADEYIAIWRNPHVVIGLIVFTLMLFQPAFGYIHHVIFVKRANGRRTYWGWIHVWQGRLLIVLGIVNGGLGLRLVSQSPVQSATTTRKAEIGYSVAAGVMFLVYASVAAWSEVKRFGRPARGAARDEDDQTTSSGNTFQSHEYKVYRTNDGPILKETAA